MLTRDGRRIEVEVRISPIRNAEGRLLGASSIAHDIGERKRIERELVRWRDELAKSNAELERFAYVASHDLQEPLRMVASYMQLLAQRYRGRLDSDADEFIGFAVDGANRMKNMIADLLKYSRAGRGDDFTKFNSGVALDHALANLQFAIGETGATITHDRMPEISGIPPQMVELFQNLIGNALKFHGDRAPRIHVSARRAGSAWEFAVADNGIGIAPHIRKGCSKSSAVCMAARNTPVPVSDWRYAARSWSITEVRSAVDSAGRKGRDIPFHFLRIAATSGRFPPHGVRLIEILLVEDNPGDARLAIEALRHGKFASHLSVVEDGGGGAPASAPRRKLSHREAPRPGPARPQSAGQGRPRGAG